MQNYVYKTDLIETNKLEVRRKSKRKSNLSFFLKLERILMIWLVTIIRFIQRNNKKRWPTVYDRESELHKNMIRTLA